MFATALAPVSQLEEERADFAHVRFVCVVRVRRVGRPGGKGEGGGGNQGADRGAATTTKDSETSTCDTNEERHAAWPSALLPSVVKKFGVLLSRED